MKPSKKRKLTEQGWALRSKGSEQAFAGVRLLPDIRGALTFPTRREAIEYKRGRSWPQDWTIVRVKMVEV